MSSRLIDLLVLLTNIERFFFFIYKWPKLDLRYVKIILLISVRTGHQRLSFEAYRATSHGRAYNHDKAISKRSVHKHSLVYFRSPRVLGGSSILIYYIAPFNSYRLGFFLAYFKIVSWSQREVFFPAHVRPHLAYTFTSYA